MKKCMKTNMLFLLLFFTSNVFAQNFEMVSQPKKYNADYLFDYNDKLYYSLYSQKKERYELWVTEGTLNDSKFVGELDERIKNITKIEGSIFIACQGDRYLMKKLPAYYCINALGEFFKIDIGNGLKLLDQFGNPIYEKNSFIQLLPFNKNILVVVGLLRKNIPSYMREAYQYLPKVVFSFNPITKKVSNPFNKDFKSFGKFYQYDELLFFSAELNDPNDTEDNIYTFNTKNNTLIRQKKGSLDNFKGGFVSQGKQWFNIDSYSFSTGLISEIFYFSNDKKLTKFADAQTKNNVFFAFNNCIYFVKENNLMEINFNGVSKLTLEGRQNSISNSFEDHFILKDTSAAEGSLYVITSIAKPNYKQKCIWLYNQKEKNFIFHRANSYLPYSQYDSGIKIITGNNLSLAFFEGQLTPPNTDDINEYRDLLNCFNRSKSFYMSFADTINRATNSQVRNTHFWNNDKNSTRIILIGSHSKWGTKPFLYDINKRKITPLGNFDNTSNYAGSLNNEQEIEYNNKLYFTVRNEYKSKESYLWCTDGTKEGTTKVGDEVVLYAGVTLGYDQINKSVVYKNKLYFIGKNKESSDSETLQIWRYSDR